MQITALLLTVLCHNIKVYCCYNLAADAATSLTLSDQDETFTLTDARRVSDLGALTSLNITGTDGDSQNGVVNTLLM